MIGMFDVPVAAPERATPAQNPEDRQYEPLPTEIPSPTVVLMAGFAGAGKTTLARRLSYWLHWEVLNKDVLKLKRLAQGKDVKQADWDKFVEQAGWEAFEELFELIEKKVVVNHQSVIIDTSNEKPFIFESVQEVLKKLMEHHVHAQLKIILCVANKEVRTVRLHKRKSVFEPYVHELPTILDDSELPERFKHLLASEVNKVLIVNTNPPLATYDWKVRRMLAQSTENQARIVVKNLSPVGAAVL